MKKFKEIRLDEKLQSFAQQDPPTMLVLRRRAIRVFPGGQRVATYRNDNLDLDVAIPYNPATLGKEHISTLGTNYTQEEVNLEEGESDSLFGEYLDNPHPRIEKAVSHRFGAKALQHMKLSAQHYLAGDMKTSNHHWEKYRHEVSLRGEETEYPVVEATLHNIHAITKTKVPADVRFRNGASAKVTHDQASHIMKLHGKLNPLNKRKVEDLLNHSPQGFKKVWDFAHEHLK